MSRYDRDRQKAEAWASQVLKQPGVIIFDTETTDMDGEIIELAIIGIDGEVLYNGRFNPLTHISRGAYQVHGISEADLAECPSWAEEWAKIRAIFAGASLVLSYNIGFDRSRLITTHELAGTQSQPFAYECIMLWYAQWYGEWNRYRGGYKWQPLESGDHSALGDAQAALACLQKMARSAQPV